MIAMGSDQHFCLRWNNFHSNIATSFEHLRDHEDFVDVTLACEGRSLKAHKVVLSACSPYFRNLLKQNPCQHPIIILRDVAYVDMSALLSFVYQGEVYVSQDRLSTFLRTAEMLHIKGLTEQNQHHPHIGTHQLHRDSGGLVNKVVSSLGAIAVQGPSSPRRRSTPSPTTHILQQPSHISPPPKKRRPTSSPTHNLTLSTAAPSTPPRSDIPPSRLELSPHLEGSTLAAALTKPLNHTNQRGDNTPRSTQQASPQQLAPPPLLPATLPVADVPKVKQEDEGEGGGVEEDSHMPDQAVNLVTEGSILRQRIQGYSGSCEASQSLPPPPTSSSSSRPSPVLIHSHIVKEDSHSDDTNLGDVGELGDGTGEKEALASPPPMVIRPPLMGLLPREAAGLYPGPGTSGSLGQHDSSQDAPARQRWRCMQPRLCPFCWKTFSNSFNLKQHIVNVHTVGEGIECELCHKVVKNKWYLRKHHVTAHGAPLRRSKGPSETKSGKPLSNTGLSKELGVALNSSPHQMDPQQQQEVFTKKQMDHAEYLVRTCIPRLWNSRQPGICPICNRIFSNKFNLKQHIINIHTKGEGVDCDVCQKKCKNKWYLRRHQVTHHGAPLKRNRTYTIMEQYMNVNDENAQGAQEAEVAKEATSE